MLNLFSIFLDDKLEDLKAQKRKIVSYLFVCQISHIILILIDFLSLDFL